MKSLYSVSEWITCNGLELVIEKTEAVVHTNKNKHNKIIVLFGNSQIKSQLSLHYLGVQVNARLHFDEHAELAAKRITEAKK